MTLVSAVPDISLGPENLNGSRDLDHTPLKDGFVIPMPRLDRPIFYNCTKFDRPRYSPLHV